MKTKIFYLVILFSITYFSVNSQNLLDTSTWTVSFGSVSGFGKNGSTSENSREYGVGPKDTSVLLWKATPDASSNADGGWNTSHYNVDHKKTYRLVVWLKKTNSNTGSSYFGFHSYNGSHHSLRLDGNSNNNPYFWSGDLPQLNKWYMLVGYVHGSNYSSTVNYGGIYDGVTGEKVRSITDFKFKSTATKLRHRSYLYYDTNTSDRQYFYAPRMELVDGNEPSVEELLGQSTFDNNSLKDFPWTIGSGSISGFSQNGATSENSRELGRNHIGEEVVLWKAAPDASRNADGGWSTSWIGANSNTSYRFSVWIKKTNSNDGSTYFGFHANARGSLRLNGTYNGNPYFWAGDLPKLNRWYLLVGYVHKSSHTGTTKTTNTGGIYDGTTGRKVRIITDYKLKNTVTAIIHRSYLFYDTNILDRQYFYEPRIDPISGNEPTIEELLRINDDSKLIISYDMAGNQTQNFYCNDLDFCSPPAAKKKEKEEAIFSAELHEDPIHDEESLENVEGVFVYPNPTDGLINIKLSSALIKNIHSIKLYNVNSSLVKEIKTEKEIIDLYISRMANGVYFLHIHLKEGKSITKKIIKK